VLGKKGEHINIGKLERFIADFDGDVHLTREDIPAKTRGKVAVVGSGPAGLTVSGDLSRMGFAVEVFEQENEAGGVLMYGIPEYRLPKEVVRREIRKIEELGVVFHYNTTVGKDITIDALLNEQGFDAVFIGTGTSKPKALDIPGNDLKGVRLATHFLRRMQLFSEGFIGHDEVSIRKGHHVFVIGCGNTAMDASRTAIRIGAANVEVVYHRTEKEMSALRAEYEDAVKEGVKFNWNSSITEIHSDENGEMTEVVIETKTPIETPEGEEQRYEITTRVAKADRVVMAVGAAPDKTILRSTSGIDRDPKGFLLTRDLPYGMTSKKGVFAGGDVANRQATVVHAMQDAKKVAEGIARYVDAVKLMEAINLKE
jgi:glutamate synthase (NADPH/NADH) small chain